jgi:branched-chain amino acid transport system substrate-binding protein
MLIAEAMMQAGSAEPARYLPVLAATRNRAGASGMIDFDAKGDLQRPTLGLYTYRGEELQPVRNER